MMRTLVRASLPLALAAFAMGLATPTLAQPKPVGWTTTANLSAVLTGGNAQATSFGLKGRTERNWLRTQFFVEGGGIKQDSTEHTRYAVGTPASFTVTDTSTTKTNAENYFASTGFEHRVSERFFWNLRAGFTRDLFSGVEQLYSGRAGMGYLWTDRTRQDLKLGLAASYNHEKDTVPDPDTKADFAALGLTADYGIKFGTGQQSSFTSKLAVDQNLQVSKDLRSLWDNALTVSMSRRLALQLGAKWAYRNLPALQEVDLFLGSPPPGARPVGRVFVPYQKSDYWLTVSFVLNWGPGEPSGAKPAP
jgi:hypothetical protein